MTIARVHSFLVASRALSTTRVLAILVGVSVVMLAFQGATAAFASSRDALPFSDNDDRGQSTSALQGSPVLLTGRVTTESGSPLEGARVMALQWDGSGLWWVIGVSSTGGDGVYTIELQPGRYDLEVTPPEGSTLLTASAFDVLLQDGTSLDIVLTNPTHNPPVTRLSVEPPAEPQELYSNPSLLLLTARPATGHSILHTYYSLDLGPFLEYLGPVSLSNPGEHTIRFYSIDEDSVVEAGNRAPIPVGTQSPTKGSILGTVRDIVGRPITGESVNVALDTGQTTCSNPETGTYAFSGIPLGTYFLSAGHRNACGDTGHLLEYWEDASAADDATPVTLTSSEPVAAQVDFTLDVGGVITGIVLDPTGAPVSGADIEVLEGDRWQGIASFRTGSSGIYRIAGLSTGDYRVSVRAAGYADEIYDDFHFFLGQTHTRVHVEVGTTPSEVDFSLEPGAAIRGRVTNGAGEPILGVTPWVDALSDVGGRNGGASNADGYYEIIGLPTGDYRVGFFAPPIGYGAAYYPGTTYIDDAIPVSLLAPADSTGIDVVLPAGGSISGLVFEADGTTPIAGADVWIGSYPDNRGVAGNTSTDESGHYRIRGVAVGQYFVQASAPGHGSWFYPDAVGLESSTPIMVSAGAETSDINFRVPAGGSISGSVYASDGVTPLQNIGVQIGPWGQSQCTDANGRYALSGLPFGDYQVVAGRKWCAPHSYIDEWWPDALWASSAGRITLDASQPEASGIDFTLDLGGNITGFITDSGGDPVEGVEVCVSQYDGPEGVGCFNSGADGTYAAPGLPEGDYRVSAWRSGYALEYYSDTTDWGAASRVAVSGTDTTSGIDFQMAPGGTISGTVYASDGTTPLANIGVEIGPWGYGQCTDADGHFTLTGIPYGDWQVVAGRKFCEPNNYIEEWWSEDLWASSADWITLSAFQPDVGNIDFTLDEGGRITGTIVDGNSVPVPDVDVCVGLFDGSEGVGCFRSGPDGSYEVLGVPSGDYFVQTWPPEQYAPGQYYDQVYQWDQRSPIHVEAPNTVSGIDFVLHPSGGTGTVSGIVLHDGEPIAGAPIWIGWDHHLTCTAEDGTFTVADLPFYEGLVATASRDNDWNPCTNQDFLDESGLPLLTQYWDHHNQPELDRIILDPGHTSEFVQFDVANAAALQQVTVTVHVIDQAGSGTCPGGDASCDLPANDANLRVFNTSDPAFIASWGADPDPSLYQSIRRTCYGSSACVETWGTGWGLDETGEASLRYSTAFPNLLYLVWDLDDVDQTSAIVFGRPLAGMTFVDRGDGVLVGPAIDLRYVKLIHEDGSIELLPDRDGDGIPDGPDNAPDVFNPDQREGDGDSLADVIDPCPADLTNTCNQDRSAAVSIGSSGGTLETPNGDVSLIVSEGALDDDTSISFTDSDAGLELDTDLGPASPLYAVVAMPTGTVFEPPATIILAWPDENNDGVVDDTSFAEADLRVSKDGVVLTERCAVDSHCDATANTFSIEVPSFSQFVLIVLMDTDGDGVVGPADQCPNENALGFDADVNGCIDTPSGLLQIINTLPADVLSPKIRNSLVSKVESAINSLDRDKDEAAVNKLGAFVNEVRAQAGKKISLEAAAQLIEYAENLVELINTG